MTEAIAQRSQLAHAFAKYEDAQFALVSRDGRFKVLMEQDLEEHKGRLGDLLYSTLCELGELTERQTPAALLVRAVGQPGRCDGCGSEVFWVKHRSGKTGIYDPTGLSHWASCTKPPKR